MRPGEAAGLIILGILGVMAIGLLIAAIFLLLKLVEMYG